MSDQSGFALKSFQGVNWASNLKFISLKLSYKQIQEWYKIIILVLDI